MTTESTLFIINNIISTHSSDVFNSNISQTSFITIIKDIVTILAILLGGYISIFVYLYFAPVVKLNITYYFIDEEYVKLELQVENIGRIRMTKEKIQLQILYHNISGIKELSEWVPFTENGININEKPLEWKEPIDIFTTTRFLYPHDQIKADRLYKIPKGQLIHIGMQVNVKLGKISGVFAGLRKQPLRWTATRIIVSQSLHILPLT